MLVCFDPFIFVLNVSTQLLNVQFKPIYFVSFSCRITVSCPKLSALVTHLFLAFAVFSGLPLFISLYLFLYIINPSTSYG